MQRALVISYAIYYFVNIHPQSIVACFFFSHLFFIHFTEWITIWKFIQSYFAYLNPIHIALLSSFVCQKEENVSVSVKTFQFSHVPAMAIFLFLFHTSTHTYKTVSHSSVSVSRPLSSIFDFHYHFRAITKGNEINNGDNLTNHLNGR